MADVAAGAIGAEGSSVAVRAADSHADGGVSDETGPSAANGTAARPGGCTQAQLRRFIKSRPYVPMHELRRRFALNGTADDVTAIPTAQGIVFLGLPGRESQFISELLRNGDIGVELCHDPSVPMVVGVYAMRPVSR
jgi:hypothetical protein